MTNKQTLIVAILDASGSISSLLDDYIEGYNSFIATQREEAPEDLLTLIFFDSKGWGREIEARIRTEFKNKALKNVDVLNRDTYRPEGGTPLYDAIGLTIDNIGKELSNMNKSERPEKVLFLIQTDGQENTSRKYTKAMVRDRIEHQRNKYSWEFVFLSADESTLEDAKSFGIPLDNAIAYRATAKGARESYVTMSNVTTSYRSS